LEQHKKLAFLKFFITYFISVALLILVAGFFYFSQMKNHLLKTEEFLLIEYARHIKQGKSLVEYKKDYRHIFIDKNKKYIDMKNFTITKDEFSKLIPTKHNGVYLQVIKSKKSFDNKLWNLKEKIISLQLLLLLLFAYISYRLAMNALKPLTESIATLDKFAKDLIHDLNTPVTSIKLNMKLLEKIPNLQNNKAILRLNKSVNNISELHENLTILLQEETFQMQVINVCDIVKEVIEVQKSICPDIKFLTECSYLNAKLNANAIKQILQNIIANACKYNFKNGYVKIYKKSNALYIEDNGKGIREPSRIFERSYSDENSSGIGLDIVKRLSNAMGINIELTTSQTGSCFILNFKRS
jgi:two-component system OmpR family sensor kinase